MTSNITVILIITLAILVGLYINRSKASIKSPTIKKDEIFIQYKNQLLDILEKTKDNKELQKKEKNIFLKQCNCELSRNIFFTEDEAKQIIQKLAIL